MRATIGFLVIVNARRLKKNEQQSRPPLANIVKSYYICAIYDGQASGFFVTET